MFRASSAHLQQDIVVRTYAAYGTVTLYKSSWWPVDTQLAAYLFLAPSIHIHNYYQPRHSTVQTNKPSDKYQPSVVIFVSYLQILGNIQDVSRLVDITAGGDFPGLCDQKSSYKHVSDFGRLRSYDRLELRMEGNDY